MILDDIFGFQTRIEIFTKYRQRFSVLMRIKTQLNFKICKDATMNTELM